MAWLVMPMRLLRGYIVALPRLRAEESIRRVSETRVAQGVEGADEVFEAWLDEAGREKEEKDADGFYF